jgi:hypothetical protein
VTYLLPLVRERGVPAGAAARTRPNFKREGSGHGRCSRCVCPKWAEEFVTAFGDLKFMEGEIMAARQLLLAGILFAPLAASPATKGNAIDNSALIVAQQTAPDDKTAPPGAKGK